MQLFGCGSVAQVVTTEDQKGQYLSINLGFALGTCFGVFVSRGVSGKTQTTHRISVEIEKRA